MSGYTEGEFLVSMLMTLAGGLLLGAMLSAKMMGDCRSDFAADRACRPGMLVERLDGDRALCIGGQRETWIVEVP